MKTIILGSQSPRRAELLDLIGVSYTVEVRAIDEVFPDTIAPDDVAAYLAELKASAFKSDIGRDTILITADSVVIVDHTILGKPKTLEEAKSMIAQLSGRRHRVVTGVHMYSVDHALTFSDTAYVDMDVISQPEIDYYVEQCQPLDKAGAYGIQEWIGYAKISRIEGTFATIMGLPVHKVYRALVDHFGYHVV